MSIKRFQVNVVKTPIKDQYTQCLWKEGKKEEESEGGEGDHMTGCNYGKGHTSGPHT